MLNTEIIKAEALRLGFDLIGITDPKPVAGYSRFAEWLAGGYHASMQYLDTPRSHALRAAPEQVLPGCQTILCVAKQYPKPPVLKSTSPIRRESQLMPGKTIITLNCRR
jgi:epoxyqueuosine reductase